MLKKQLSTVITVLLILAVAGTSWASNISGPGRPLLAVNGTTRPDLSMEINSISYDSSLNRLEVTLNNWDAAGPSYKHSDSSLFMPGVSISIFMGPSSQQIRIFDGTVTAMAPHFNDFTPSTITVVATGTPQNPKTNTIQMRFGQDLRQFDPVLGSSGVITCTGITEGNPEIQVGTSVSVSGAGQRFSQTYHVTKVVHTFDGAKGYITQFTASTRPESSVPSLAPKRRPAS